VAAHAVRHDLRPHDARFGQRGGDGVRVLFQGVRRETLATLGKR